MRSFWIALAFLTRLPTPGAPVPTPQEMGHSILYFPAVGLLLGVILAVAAWLFSGLNPALAAALLLACGIALTGVLHLDGLADSADAWAGGHGDADRTLSIMKDPRSGAAGVTAVVMMLMLQYGALQVIVEQRLWGALIAAPVAGRAAAAALFLTTPYVRRHGLGEALAQFLPRRALAWMLVVSAIAIAAAAGGSAWSVLAVAAGVFWLGRRAMMLRIGGTTGDTAGAMVVGVECAVLVVMAWK